MVCIVLRSQKPAFFGAKRNHQDAAFRFHRTRVDCFCDLNQGSRTGTIVIGSRIEFAALRSKVIEMRPDTNVFVPQDFFAARIPADDVRHVDRFTFDRQPAIHGLR